MIDLSIVIALCDKCDIGLITQLVVPKCIFLTVVTLLEEEDDWQTSESDSTKNCFIHGRWKMPTRAHQFTCPL